MLFNFFGKSFSANTIPLTFNEHDKKMLFLNTVITVIAVNVVFTSLTTVYLHIHPPIVLDLSFFATEEDYFGALDLALQLHVRLLITITIVSPEICFILIVLYYLLEGLFSVTTNNSKTLFYFPILSGYYCFRLATSLLITGILFTYWYYSFMAGPISADLGVVEYFHSLYYYGNLIITPLVMKLKIIIAFLVAFILYLSSNYLKITKLNNYEFAIFISLALISLWVAISSQSWILLYLALELQAICLLILIAWSRHLVSSITTSLKYGVINFIASAIILYGIVRLILLTGTTSFSNLSLFELLDSTIITNTSNNYILGLPLAFLLLGLLIKLGVAPLAFWVPEIYAGIPLPVLIFFATIPKLVYVFLISTFVTTHFSLILVTQFKWLFLGLAIITSTIGTFGLITENRDIIRFIGYSSISNMGILCLIWGFMVHDTLGVSVTYMLYYIINTLLFLGVFTYLYIPLLKRQVFYFSDLQIFIRHSSLFNFYLIIGFSFFSFLGLPPLLGFWGKFLAVKAIIPIIITSYEWAVLVWVILITVAGGFGYIRLFNIISSEIPGHSATLSIKPISDNILYFYFYLFILIQIIGCLYATDILDFLSGLRYFPRSRIF